MVLGPNELHHPVWSERWNWPKDNWLDEIVGAMGVSGTHSGVFADPLLLGNACCVVMAAVDFRIAVFCNRVTRANLVSSPGNHVATAFSPCGVWVPSDCFSVGFVLREDSARCDGRVQDRGISGYIL